MSEVLMVWLDLSRKRTWVRDLRIVEKVKQKVSHAKAGEKVFKTYGIEDTLTGEK